MPPKAFYVQNGQNIYYQNHTVDDIARYKQQYGVTGSSDDFNRWLRWYDNYLSKIQPYEGTEYYQQLLNNPSASFKPWKGSVFQTIGNSMTGSLSNTFYNGREQEAERYFNDILGNMQENNHNSAMSQVARDRAAGLNDALSGSIAGDTPAADSAMSETPPAAGPEDDTGAFTQFLQDATGLASGFITGCVNLKKAFNEIGLQDIQLDQADANLTNTIVGATLEQEASKLPAPTKNPDTGEYDFSAVLDNVVLDPAKKTDTANPPYKRSRNKQLYKRMRGTIAYDENGKPTVALQRAYKKMYADAAEDTVRGARALSQPGYSDNMVEFAGQIAEVETNVINAIRAAQLETQKSLARSAGAKANYDEGYYSGDLGASTAQNELDEFDAAASERAVRKSKAKFEKEIADSRNALIALCGSNPYAKILLPGLLTSVDSLSGRVLDHIDGLLDLAINPMGKLLGKALSGVGMDKSLQGKPVPTKKVPTQ